MSEYKSQFLVSDPRLSGSVEDQIRHIADKLKEITHQTSKELLAVQKSSTSQVITRNVGGVGGGGSSTVSSLLLRTVSGGYSKSGITSVNFDDADPFVLSDDGATGVRVDLTMSPSPSATAVGTGRTLTVAGTADRITSSAGAQDLSANRTWTIDIAGTYVGQTSITTLGTIGTGTWQGSVVGVTYGGTGANLSATGGAGQYVKQSTLGGAFTVGTIPASDIASGAALTKTDDTNVTLTLGGSPTVALLAATSLTLGWTGTLAIARGGTGQGTAVAAFNALSPLTTLGDTLYNDGTDDVRLAGNITTTKKFLRQTGTGAVSAAPAWDTLVDGDVPDILTLTKISNLTSNGFVKTSAGDGTLSIDTSTYLTSVTAHDVLSATHSDTLAAAVVLGDLIAGNSTPKWQRVAGNITTTKQFLTQTGTGAVSALPTWGAVNASDVVSAANLSVGSSLQITAGSGTGATLVAVTVDTIQDIRTTATPQWTRLGLGAVADANHLLLLSSGTITTDKHQIDGAITWNAAGVTFTGWKLNVTDTASVITSKLIDLQVGSVSKFLVSKSGHIAGVRVGATETPFATGFPFYPLDIRSSAVGINDIGIFYNTQSQANNNGARLSFWVKAESSGSGPNQDTQIAAISALIPTGATIADGWTGDLLFYTTPAGGSITERMRIDNTGTVSIANLTHCLANFGATGAMTEISHVASGQVLTSAGTTTAPAWSASPTLTGLTLSGLTQGSVLFVGASGVISQDNANFFWDDTNNRLGIGTTAPAYPVMVDSSINGLAAGQPTLVIQGSANKERLSIKSFGASPASGFEGIGAGGTVASPTATLNGNFLLFLGGGGYDNAGTPAATGNKALFTIKAAESFTTTAQGTFFTWETTAAGGTTRSEKMRFTSVGNLKIAGTATRATTEGTNHLDIFDGTAPVGTLANGISLFSASGKLKSADAAGTVGFILSSSSVNVVSPTSPNRTITVDIGGTTYYIHAKTTND